jgi:hypothetical protein
MPKKNVKVVIDNDASSDDEPEYIERAKEEVVKVRAKEPEPQPQPAIIERKKRVMSETGKAAVLKNLEVAQLKKQITDLQKRLSNGGQTPTEMKKEAKKKATEESLRAAIKNVVETTTPKKKKKIIVEESSESEEEIVVKSRSKPKNDVSTMDELQRALMGQRQKNYFI